MEIDNSSYILQGKNDYFRLGAMRRHEKKLSTYQQSNSYFSLLVFMEMKGQVIIDSMHYSLDNRHLFIVPCGSWVHISLNGDNSYYYDIQFEALEALEKSHLHLILNESVELVVKNWDVVKCFVEELDQLLNKSDKWKFKKVDVYFQEMFIPLLEHDVQERKKSVNQHLYRTIEYMEQHISEQITRNELAAVAGLNPDYYSRIFKKIYKKSPVTYLTELRIRHAKQRMIQSNESIKSIAFSLGFRDEFYFSRKFKTEIGVAPTIYVNRIKMEGKLASLNHLVTGHLLALKTEPYAAIVNAAFPVKLNHTLMLGEKVPELNRLWDIKPDLIIGRGKRGETITSYEQMVGQIAPSIILDYSEDWRTHFQRIARIIGKEHEADRWMDYYEDKAEKLRHRIKGRIGDDRVLIVAFGIDNNMYLFGKRNIGTVLYNDLHLTAPKGVDEIAHYKEITMDELLCCEADHIIFTNFQHDGSTYADWRIQHQLNILLEDERWKNHIKQKEIKTYNLFDMRHLYTSYNAMSHEILLDKILEVFERNNNNLL
ncbi:AraC family transcriptional regulator [Lysinibacillus telephonicus]|uniref:AraC family transcriptional regulator n=1 Tax=Lysinibacillus telephonicus TaxID=1714840 RepID=UPI0031FC0B14